VPEQRTKSGGKIVIPDGTLRDAYNLHRGLWEAKDGKDDLNVEIQKKIAKGYPLTNIIFEDTRRAVLFQNGQERLRALGGPRAVSPPVTSTSASRRRLRAFDQAVDEFKGVFPTWRKAQESPTAPPTTRSFAAFDHFFSLCRPLNQLSRAAVDELVQHLLPKG
jgi:hypothetical protein